MLVVAGRFIPPASVFFGWHIIHTPLLRYEKLLMASLRGCSTEKNRERRTYAEIRFSFRFSFQIRRRLSHWMPAEAGKEAYKARCSLQKGLFLCL